MEEKRFYCIMCKEEAEYIVEETEEPLCEKCMRTNEEAKDDTR